jgi:RNA polymerase sigma-70 factor (ECF subfamily)
LTNDLGAGGRSGPKRGFGGFRGARRLRVTTPTVDRVKQPEEVAQGQMSGNTGRRRQARFEAIALPHLDAAYALARWMTRNDADAADVMQEAFLRAFRYFDSYREGDTKSWVLKIVRRTCYTWLERNRPADVVSLEAEEEFGDAVATPAIETEALLESRSDLRHLDQLIEALPAPLREAIVLRELHELGYREIAEVTGVPIGTVMSRLHRARSLLLRAWDENETVNPSADMLVCSPRRSGRSSVDRAETTRMTLDRHIVGRIDEDHCDPVVAHRSGGEGHPGHR